MKPTDPGIVTGYSERKRLGTPIDHGPDPHVLPRAERIARGREEAKQKDEEQRNQVAAAMLLLS